MPTTFCRHVCCVDGARSPRCAYPPPLTPRAPRIHPVPMMKGPNAFWITWELQPRNRSMARELGVPLHELCFSGSRLARHLKSVVSTLRLLLRERPSVVFSSNPSLVLTYLLLVCRWLGAFRLTIDAHFGGVVAVTGNRFIQWVLDFANRQADTVIVTNE